MASKENDRSAGNQSKKPRLSLSLKGKNTKIAKSTRFEKVDSSYLEVAAKGVVPENTIRNNRWVVNNFSEWKKSIIENDQFVPDDLLSCTDADLVCKWLCRYVLETRQESGKPYPPKSLYMLLCGLLRISRSEGGPFNFLDKTTLVSRTFTIHLTLYVATFMLKGLELLKDLLLS